MPGKSGFQAMGGLSRDTRKNVVADAEKQLLRELNARVQPPQSPSPIFIGSFCFSRFPLHTQWTGMFPLLTSPAIFIARSSSGSGIDCKSQPFRIRAARVRLSHGAQADEGVYDCMCHRPALSSIDRVHPRQPRSFDAPRWYSRPPSDLTPFFPFTTDVLQDGSALLR